MKRAERDRREERKNGWPEGYIEQKRILKKQAKKQKKHSHSDDSDNENTYITSKQCYVCNKEKMFSQKTCGVNGICSTCIPAHFKNKNKKVLTQLLKKVQIISCMNCKLETRKINHDNLCLICQDSHKTTRCLKCINSFSHLKENNEQFCMICKPNIKHCLDCSKVIMYTEKYRTRCNDCFKIKKQAEKYIDQICESCNDCFEILEDQQEWRKKCPSCHRKTITTCEDCNEYVKILTVKKDGLTKGKQFYNCTNCKLFKWFC
jgi:hypothetical protein